MGRYDVAEAAAYIARRMRKAGIRDADDALLAWIRLAIDADLTYMRRAGVEVGDAFDSSRYDPDDACDFICEALSGEEEADDEAAQTLLMRLNAFMDAEMDYLEEIDNR